jgi:hypothetical protein
MNIPTDERTSFDEQGRGGQSECARAMAEAEKVLRELALFTRRSKSEPSNAATRARKAPALVPASFPIDRVVLDPGLDFTFHKDGTIELTGVGFRRMAQAHCAAIDVVIGIDGRDVLRFPAGIDALPEKEITEFARASWGTWFERWARNRNEVPHNDQ